MSCRDRGGPEDQLDDLLPGCLVEIAGRFVGDDDGRIWRERAGKRHALLFAARSSADSGWPAAQSDGDQFALGAGECVERAGEFKRDGNVFQRRHGRDEVKGLEDDADILAAKTRKSSSSSLRRSFPGDDDRAGVGPLQPGHHHEQR